MSEYAYRNEISPPAVVYLENRVLPTANTDLCDPITITGPKDKIGAFEIYFESTVAGTLKLKRVANSVTTYSTLNFGNSCSANVPAGPQIIPFSSGEVISLQYSGTGGTFYLTIADVSGDIVKKAKA